MKYAIMKCILVAWGARLCSDISAAKQHRRYSVTWKQVQKSMKTMLLNIFFEFNITQINTKIGLRAGSNESLDQK